MRPPSGKAAAAQALKSVMIGLFNVDESMRYFRSCNAEHNSIKRLKSICDYKGSKKTCHHEKENIQKNIKVHKCGFQWQMSSGRTF